MKYFRMSYEEVVFNRSYINIMLLNKAIPNFKSKLDKDSEGIGTGSRGKGAAAESVKHIKPQSGHANGFFQQFM